ncbi:MAG: DUF790 family protein [Pirellulaceae bacterium]|nr:DUF790 family protein [Pirellulaceae bacterium]
MLTRELAIAAYDLQRGELIPDRLTQRTHARYLRHAERAVRVYRRGQGRTRRELHGDVHRLFAAEEDCPARRIDALCKLLDDASQYARDRRGRAAALRREVFQQAALRHPLVTQPDRLFESREAAVKQQLAEKLGQTWPEVERQLFADVIDFHRLCRFDPEMDGRSLLARYNVAQVQAALYGAAAMTVWASEDFKTIVRYAKLARLMHTIQRDGPAAYRMQFDGPASALRGTRRYGVAMARFLPALLACRDWRMQARIPARRGDWTWRLRLTSQDGLHSHLPSPDEFDSTVECQFAEQWGADPREGWTLERESELLHCGQKVFVPDFVLRHQDGRAVLLEVVGFWTPEYLQAKLQTLELFRSHSILLAVDQQPRAAADYLGKLSRAAAAVIPYKTRLKVQDVLAAVQSQVG